ncbi:MAG TPA: hypothetical protein VF006_13290 [Longimicrobium sp.]
MTLPHGQEPRLRGGARGAASRSGSWRGPSSGCGRLSAPRARSAPCRSSTRRCTDWVEPEAVIEVRFQDWTDDGRIRFPVSLGFRQDKRPEEVVREP